MKQIKWTWRGEEVHNIQTDDNKVFRMYMKNYTALAYGKPRIRLKLV